MEATRKALAELGREAKPLEIREYLKSKFGIDTSTSLISTYKTVLLKKGKGKKAAVGSHRSGTRANGRFSLEDIKAVKELSDRIGADKVKELAELLSK
jgi:hypothetical protein